MDPQTRAKIEFEAAQFRARQESGPQHDYSDLADEMRPHVFAHAAFALLDQAIAENVSCLRSQGVLVECKRLDTTIVVSLGLRRASFMLKLSDKVVRIGFFTSSPYAGGGDRPEFISPWPADVVPIEHLSQPIHAFMEDMRAFLLNGTRPS